jgi:hypothetical protein
LENFGGAIQAWRGTARTAYVSGAMTKRYRSCLMYCAQTL